jgi:hypothetical protein
MSRLLEMGDGEPVTYEDPKIGPKVMMVDKEFGIGFIISEKQLKMIYMEKQIKLQNGSHMLLVWLMNIELLLS